MLKQEAKNAPASLAVLVGWRASLLVSTLIACSHGMFLWGQLGHAMMDIEFSANLMYQTHGAIAEAVGVLEKSVCQTDCPGSQSDLPTNASAAGELCGALECTYCNRDVGVTTAQHCEASVEETVKQFGYLWAVTEMWTQDRNLAGGCRSNHLNHTLVDHGGCTGDYPGRPAAVFLFGFSFLWPHVKLLALHVCFYLPLRPTFRRNANFWLSFLGKWTLTDVLVCCALLGLLDIYDERTIAQLWSQATDAAPQLCDALCANRTDADHNNHNNHTTTTPEQCVAACHAVANLLNESDAFVAKGLPDSEVEFSVSMRGARVPFATPLPFLHCTALAQSVCSSCDARTHASTRRHARPPAVLTRRRPGVDVRLLRGSDPLHRNLRWHRIPRRPRSPQA